MKLANHVYLKSFLLMVLYFAIMMALYLLYGDSGAQSTFVYNEF
ncbi:teichoic acid D-Ala incorporation-associated protein DltX [Staphylococcus chromogenes]|nr:teichoic acid D-Ala incorporation-associated protein DltX [Staphylococcus chromogenes]MCD8905353.1 teichoic acid D-Ala incorporation-associated protein DltX [Staphylococcus chromogenes]MCE4965332.1 teichoic acid D-Ala incorporation-associated protein DltX [Staphylococcus chromogenes]MEB7824220.1 teichoic acid D-Ala incorporation-associated protein DltX [Staphylococcus chromogenes]PTF76688.1 teichoic acid D-Ala incorporation-associated protein DltX [Staphylococcus chromogenes]PTG53019.1 teic